MEFARESEAGDALPESLDLHAMDGAAAHYLRALLIAPSSYEAADGLASCLEHRGDSQMKSGAPLYRMALQMRERAVEDGPRRRSKAIAEAVQRLREKLFIYPLRGGKSPRRKPLAAPSKAELAEAEEAR